MRYDVAKLRKELGLNQKELAAAIGIKQSFLSTIENGKSNMPADKLERLALLCQPRSLDDYIMEPADSSSAADHHQHSHTSQVETLALRDLLNYFHSQAHKEQDEHHAMMHRQLHSLQERNDRLTEKNDHLQQKIEDSQSKLEEVRSELQRAQTEILRLKTLLLNHGLSF